MCNLLTVSHSYNKGIVYDISIEKHDNTYIREYVDLLPIVYRKLLLYLKF